MGDAASASRTRTVPAPLAHTGGMDGTTVAEGVLVGVAAADPLHVAEVDADAGREPVGVAGGDVDGVAGGETVGGGDESRPGASATPLPAVPAPTTAEASPKHTSVPLERAAQLWRAPAVTVTAPPPTASTVGTSHCPASLEPKHTTRPPRVTASVWCPPAATADAAPTTDSSRGTVAWPRLLPPQHTTCASQLSAHVCSAPVADTAVKRM